MNEDSLLATLEQLRDLISASIVCLQQNERELHSTSLSLHHLELHPIHQATNIDVRKALKTISSSSQMLRALTDPQTFLNDIYMGFHDGTALLVCVQADVANIIGSSEMHINEIAKEAGIESDKLARYMRNLCNSHIFRETAPDTFANTSLSGMIRDEGKRAHVAHCLDLVRRSSCKAWEALTRPGFKESNAPDKTAFNLAYNTDLRIFEYLSEVEPEIGTRTKIAFASGTRVNTNEFLGLYPWAKEGTAKIVDVGGGAGGGTMPVIKAFEKLTLLVQDIPDTRSSFDKTWNEACPEAIKDGRVRFTPHDFFAPQTEEADIYFMRHVIHDWPDEDSVKILANISAKMASSAKLLICEHVVLPSYRIEGDTGLTKDDFVAPEPLLPNWGATHTSRLDLQVLNCLNARQRTQFQYVELVRKAKLEVVHVWKNMGPLAIVECRKID